jgi:hypothetical protein
MARVPFGLIGEYRGVKPAGEWKTPEGEMREFGAQLRFEVQLPDGDIEVLGLRQEELDKVAKFDASKLEKGQSVHLSGVVSFGVGKKGAYCILDVMACEMASAASVKASSSAAA